MKLGIPANVEDSGKLLASFAVIGAAIWAILVFIFQPLAETWLFKALARNPARLEEVCETPFAKRDEETIRRFDAIDAELERQRSQLEDVPRFSDAVEQNAKALVAITETMQTMREEMTQTRLSVARIEGYMDGPWDGKDRRQGERRSS